MRFYNSAFQYVLVCILVPAVKNSKTCIEYKTAKVSAALRMICFLKCLPSKCCSWVESLTPPVSCKSQTLAERSLSQIGTCLSSTHIFWLKMHSWMSLSKWMNEGVLAKRPFLSFIWKTTSAVGAKPQQQWNEPVT